MHGGRYDSIIGTVNFEYFVVHESATMYEIEPHKNQNYFQPLIAGIDRIAMYQ